MRLTNMTIQDLIGLMSMDFAHRPPFLGGNKLGFVLMGLRAELMAIPSIDLPASLPNEKAVFGEGMKIWANA